MMYLVLELKSVFYFGHPLINGIYQNYNFTKVDTSKREKVLKQITQPEENISFNLGIFMMKWSNKFVFISLLAISAIALTKQAWA